MYTLKFLLHRPETTEVKYFSDMYQEAHQTSDTKSFCKLFMLNGECWIGVSPWIPSFKSEY